MNRRRARALDRCAGWLRLDRRPINKFDGVFFFIQVFYGRVGGEWDHLSSCWFFDLLQKVHWHNFCILFYWYIFIIDLKNQRGISFCCVLAFGIRSNVIMSPHGWQITAWNRCGTDVNRRGTRSFRLIRLIKLVFAITRWFSAFLPALWNCTALSGRCWGPINVSFMFDGCNKACCV